MGYSVQAECHIFPQLFQRKITLMTLQYKALSKGVLFLKVGSCPNDDNSVQILFCLFLCSISIILCFESVAVQKTQDFAENSCFFRFLIFFVLEFQF